MKNLKTLVLGFIGVTVLGFSPSALTKVDFIYLDISGQPIPGEAGECIGSAHVESGQLKLMYHTKVDGNGSLHLNAHEHLMNVIVLANGTDYYRAVGTSNLGPGNHSEYVVPADGRIVVHHSAHNRMVPIGNPDLPTYLLHLVYKFTMNANNIVTAEFLKVRSECLD